MAALNPNRLSLAAVLACAGPVVAQVIPPERLQELENSPSRLSDKAIPLQYSSVGGRPQPLLELGNPYQGTGGFQENLVLPTGAVFQPTVLIWATLRSAINAVERESETRADVLQWANRLDLFGELRLSGTERLVVGMRPLDRNGVFTGYNFENTSIDRDPDVDDSVNAFNLDVQTLFFEGDFGEIFRDLDPDERHALDWGFSIGRQPLFFQDGVIVNDTIDALGITRNSLRFWGLSNVRFTGVVGVNDIERGFNVEDPDATIFGLNAEADHYDTTVELDAWYTLSDDGGDGFYYGIGATQRLWHRYNTTFRVNGSVAVDDKPLAPGMANPFVDDGLLITAEVSLTPKNTEDLVYLNGFAGFGNFTSAARGPATGGPLASIGILFAATGIGTAGPPLRQSVNESVGAAFGWQKFFSGGRQQMILELGGRVDTDRDDGVDTTEIGAIGRYQHAIGQRLVFVVDVFGGYSEIDEGFVGTRCEILSKW